jgi:hypothetical protein
MKIFLLKALSRKITSNINIIKKHYSAEFSVASSTSKVFTTGVSISTSANFANPLPYPRCTLPERRQRVHTFTLLCSPSTIALTFLILGFHILLLRLCEWLSLIPNETLLSQISHFAMTYTSYTQKK